MGTVQRGGGVIQGCAVSPWLFGAFMDGALVEVLPGDIRWRTRLANDGGK